MFITHHLGENVTNLKQRLRNMGFEVLAAVKWYAENRR